MMTPNPLEVDLEKEGDTSVMSVRGLLGDNDLNTFEQSMAEALESRRTLIDLEGIEYICSWGFGMIVERVNQAKEKGNHTVFIWPNNRLKRLFVLLQIHKMLEFADTRDEAIGMLDE